MHFQGSLRQNARDRDRVGGVGRSFRYHIAADMGYVLTWSYSSSRPSSLGCLGNLVEGYPDS
jgi:hypothetical protein